MKGDEARARAENEGHLINIRNCADSNKEDEPESEQRAS